MHMHAYKLYIARHVTLNDMCTIVVKKTTCVLQY